MLSLRCHSRRYRFIARSNLGSLLAIFRQIRGSLATRGVYYYKCRPLIRPAKTHSTSFSPHSKSTWRPRPTMFSRIGRTSLPSGVSSGRNINAAQPALDFIPPFHLKSTRVQRPMMLKARHHRCLMVIFSKTRLITRFGESARTGPFFKATQPTCASQPTSASKPAMPAQDRPLTLKARELRLLITDFSTMTME